MPTKARQILDALGVQEDKRGFYDAAIGADLEYGKPIGGAGEIGTGKGKKGGYGTIFPPLAVEE